MSNIIKVNYANVENCRDRLNNLKRDISKLDNNIKFRARNMQYETVKNTLKTLGAPDDFVWQIDKNLLYLNSVLALVNNTNYQLINYYSVTYNFISSTFSIKNGIKVISKINLVFSAITLIGNAWSLEYGDVEDHLSIGKSFVGFAGKFIEEVAKNKKNLKRLLEGKKIIKPRILPKVSKFTAVKNSLKSSFDFKIFKDGKANIGGIANCLDLVFEGAINAKQNYDEYGEVSGRMVTETAVETAVGLGIDAIAKAGATFVVGAVIGTTGLPAVIGVAIGTIVIKSVGDAVVKKVTGDKDATLKEVASDFIIDTVGTGINAIASKCTGKGNAVAVATS